MVNKLKITEYLYHTQSGARHLSGIHVNWVIIRIHSDKTEDSVEKGPLCDVSLLDTVDPRKERWRADVKMLVMWTSTKMEVEGTRLTLSTSSSSSSSRRMQGHLQTQDTSDGYKSSYVNVIHYTSPSKIASPSVNRNQWTEYTNVKSACRRVFPETVSHKSNHSPLFTQPQVPLPQTQMSAHRTHRCTHIRTLYLISQCVLKLGLFHQLRLQNIFCTFLTFVWMLHDQPVSPSITDHIKSQSVCGSVHAPVTSFIVGVKLVLYFLFSVLGYWNAFNIQTKQKIDVYWTMHHCDNWRIKTQLDAT